MVSSNALTHHNMLSGLVSAAKRGCARAGYKLQSLAVAKDSRQGAYRWRGIFSFQLNADQNLVMDQNNSGN